MTFTIGREANDESQVSGKANLHKFTIRANGHRPPLIRIMKASAEDDGRDSDSGELFPASPSKRSVNDNDHVLSQDESNNPRPLTYLVSQKLILMGMGCMYFLAFYGAYRQNEGLMGSKGLVPSKEWFDKVQESYKCPSSTTTTLERLRNFHCRRGFMDYPSLFWWFDLSDENNSTLLLVGMTLSAFCAFGRSTSTAIWLLLWILYFSVVTSAGGTSFYQYGWESQVLETGFLCAFLCQNWLWPSDMPWNSSPQTQQSSSPLILWLFRWLSFRISIGAGMIKIRGDSCWTQKTCLLYHFETQPIPSPLSFVFHFLPKWMLKRAVDLDLFVQVYTSWFVLLPTVRIRRIFLQRVADISLLIVRIGGFIQTGFMANIALSGNMSMLNHLTILPALACLDDVCYPLWLRNFVLDGFFGIPNRQSQDQGAYAWKWGSPRFWIHGMLFAGILFLSIPVVENLLELGGTRQVMNTSFGSFRLVNSYGAFGSVGKQRYEPIISIAYGNAEDSPQSELEWIEVEFPCKPGSLDRRPCFCAPYHYRLDWNIWFIGFKPHSNYLNRRETWLYHLLEKILKEDSQTNDGTARGNWWSKPNQRRSLPWLDLLDDTSREILEQRGSPLYAKVDMYRYEMAAPLWVLLPKYLRGLLEMEYDGKTDSTNAQWWNRYYEEPLLPAIGFDHQRGGLAWANV